MTLCYDEPLEIVGGEGRRAIDAQGRRYLDFFAGSRTNCLGYNIPELADAIRRQLAKAELLTATSYLIRSEIELAERIACLSDIPDAKVCFVQSGTEANELALMLACQHRHSNQVLALRNSFHGRGFATASATGIRGWSTTSLSPLHVTHVHGAYRYRGPFRHLDDADYIRACTEDLRDLLANSAIGDVACLIAEPVQGVGGYAPVPRGLFTSYREVLDEHGILLISDEPHSGWGRGGEHFWGITAHDVTPDAITFMKGLGHGLSIGAVIARPELMDALGSAVATTGCNPLATAAANAALDYLETHDLQANAGKQGTRLLTGLQTLAETSPVVGDVRGLGLMIGIELVEPGSDAPNPKAATLLQEQARSRGLLIGKGGLHDNVLRLEPPMTLTDLESDEALNILAEALNSMNQRS
ncbi:aspartate aminotransferase family protein [Streptomyces sp. NPDC048473]|uniref:aspartate aminotransferase family protein n=1 Tax=unclassified Streptomyces TaxID=2593676 RepID=UPI00371DD45D